VVPGRKPETCGFQMVQRRARGQETSEFSSSFSCCLGVRHMKEKITSLFGFESALFQDSRIRVGLGMPAETRLFSFELLHGHCRPCKELAVCTIFQCVSALLLQHLKGF